MFSLIIMEVFSNVQCFNPERQIKPDKKKVYLPSIELNPVSQLGELIWKPPLFDDPLGADRHLTQGIGLWGSRQVEFMDSMTHHLLCCSVFADDNVAALLIRFENSYHLIWNI